MAADFSVDDQQSLLLLCFSEAKCEDKHIHCKSWSNAGFCTKSPDPLLDICPKSCGVCGEVCEDSELYRSDCPAWARFGYCVRGPKTTDYILTFMNTNCKKSCGVCTPGTNFKRS